MNQSQVLTLMKGDEVVEAREERADGLLFYVGRKTDDQTLKITCMYMNNRFPLSPLSKHFLTRAVR